MLIVGCKNELHESGINNYKNIEDVVFDDIVAVNHKNKKLFL